MHTTLSTRKTAGSVRAAALAAVLAAATLLGAAPARAMTDAEQAEALIREGVRLRGQDQTARALPLFQKAYEISRTPRTAGQLGLCEMELGAYADAERHLGEALASPEHPWIAKNKPVLKRQLEAARANIGELVLTVSPAGADVLLNGKPVDAAALTGPIRVDKGQVVVEVRAAGFETARDTLNITAGQARTPHVRAGPGAAQAGGGVPGRHRRAGCHRGRGCRMPRAGRDTPAAPTDVAGTERLAAWITGGVAVGALVFGTAEALNAASKRDDFNNHTGTMGGVTYQDCGTAKLSAACKPLKDSYDSARTLSIVGFAATGALAIDLRRAVRAVVARPSARLRASPAPGGRSLVFRTWVFGASDAPFASELERHDAATTRSGHGGSRGFGLGCGGLREQPVFPDGAVASGTGGDGIGGGRSGSGGGARARRQRGPRWRRGFWWRDRGWRRRGRGGTGGGAGAGAAETRHPLHGGGRLRVGLLRRRRVLRNSVYRQLLAVQPGRIRGALHGGRRQPAGARGAAACQKAAAVDLHAERLL